MSNTQPSPGLDELIRDITKVHPMPKSQLYNRLTALLDAEYQQGLEDTLQVIYDMDKAYDGTGRKVSRGEVVKWLEYELGRGKK